MSGLDGIALGEFGTALLVTAFVLAFMESALGLGAVLPGEALVAALGALVVGPRETGLVLAAIVGGAVLGDQMGFVLGRIHGPRMAAWTARRGAGSAFERSTSFVRRHGVAAVVVSRWLPVVRTLVPVAAGASGMMRSRFALGSVVGSTAWAAWWLGAGIVLEALVESGRLGVLAVLVVPFAAVLWRRRRRGADSPAAGTPPSCPPRAVCHARWR